jgi:beta-lactamase regulating signal transducer with metallopeptidase domain
MDVLADWIWQGSAVALVPAAAMRVSTRMSASTRYRLWWVTLAVVLLLLPVAAVLGSRNQFAAVPDLAAFPAATTVSVTLPPLPWWPAALLILVWTTWATRSGWRIARALASLARAKRACQTFPHDREVRLHGWMSIRDEGRPATLALSDDVSSAAVLGLHAPVIAVSPRILDALDDQELDQILVHEWAHVQRRDDTARLVQLIVHALAGLHPAVWWIDRNLRIDREAACDDWAVNVTGTARGYAACLAKLASLSSASPAHALLPAALSASELTRRVVGLLDRRRNRSTRKPVALTAIAVLVLGAIGVAAVSIDLVVAPDTSSSAAAGSSASRVLATESAEEARVGASRPAADTVSRSSPARYSPAPERRRNADGALVRAATPSRSEERSERAAAPLHAIDASPIAELQRPGTRLSMTEPLLPAASPAPPSGPAEAKDGTPWGAAATAGVNVGRGSQKAAVATAGFFNRLGKSIAGAF